MSVEWGLLIALATGLICGWLARWQWDTRRNWEPSDDDAFVRNWEPSDEDAFDRWDRS